MTESDNPKSFTSFSNASAPQNDDVTVQLEESSPKEQGIKNDGFQVI